MKKGAFALYAAAAAASALGLIACSAEAMEAARYSLRLCGEVLIPSLFPFFVLSALIQELGLPSRMGRLAAPGMGRLFGVSGPGCAALILGLMAGYPLGAASAAGLVERGEVSREEGGRLLGFCNNSGPAFILGAAGTGVFGGARFGLLLYAAHILAALTAGVLLSLGRPRAAVRLPEIRPARAGALPAAVTASVRNMLNVCGFVIAFGVVTGTLDAVGLLPALALDLSRLTGLEISASRAAIVGFFELGGGVGAMRGLAATPVNLAVCAAVIGWGGLSVHFQTSAVVAGAEISTVRHFTGRCLSAVFSFVYVLLLAPAVI